MAENSNIEWTDHTFNPWIGCTKVSDGCKHCYAETLMDKRYGRVKWGPQGTRVRTSAANWKKPLKWNRDAEKAGKRARVFCASLADVFEDKPDQREEMDEWRRDLFHLIAKTPWLDWLLLTKRPENVIPMIEGELAFANGVANIQEIFSKLLPNVWIGTSVEDQTQAEKRIPELVKIPATARFLSMEPLLGPVDLDDLAFESAGPLWAGYNKRIDWVIVGGESGNGARKMEVSWVRKIMRQCQDASISFFFKQWGAWCPANKDHGQYTLYNGESMTIDDIMKYGHYISYDGSYVKIGKKRSGRLLNGQEWNEIPAPDPVYS